MRNVVIEGVDRLGKSTLIEGLLNTLGHFEVIHYQKPLLLDCYVDYAKRCNPTNGDPLKQFDWTGDALRHYQVQSFTNMFHLLGGPGNLILDRAHLGEAVYAHRYRGYSGDYVFELEKNFPDALDQTLLVLLVTGKFDFIQDDGQSFDFSKKEEEQADFMAAWKRSAFPHKMYIYVDDRKGGFRPKEEILESVVHALHPLGQGRK